MYVGWRAGRQVTSDICVCMYACNVCIYLYINPVHRGPVWPRNPAPPPGDFRADGATQRRSLFRSGFGCASARIWVPKCLKIGANSFQKYACFLDLPHLCILTHSCVVEFATSVQSYLKI